MTIIALRSDQCSVPHYWTGGQVSGAILTSDISDAKRFDCPADAFAAWNYSRAREIASAWEAELQEVPHV